MFNYRYNLQILIDINLIITISISIIGSFLYLNNREVKLKWMNYIYIIDFIIYTMTLNLSYSNKYKIILGSYFIFKIGCCFVLSKRTNVSNKKLSKIFIMQLILVYFSIGIFYTVNIITNIFVIRNIVIINFNKSYR
ncbi:MAG: hypothetical protein ACRCX2_28515, partial [Paraclostridium sp.]